MNSTKLKAKIILQSEELEDKLYSLNELHAELGLPFIAVKATATPTGALGSGTVHPIGGSILITHIREGWLMKDRSDEHGFMPETCILKYWKKFKDA